MPIPAFEDDGYLATGAWICTGAEFIDRYCKGEYRAKFRKAVQDIFDFAASKGASDVLFGGSFISRTDEPRDIDCVIIFDAEDQIPERTERLSIEGTSLDVFFCAKTPPEILNGFFALFSANRNNRRVGVVNVPLRSSAGAPLWRVIQEPDEDTLEIIKRVYFNRHIVDRNNNRRALITIHGIHSHGDWNAEIAHIGSSNGWIVAPFTYGYTFATIFLRRRARAKIVDRFRQHIDDIFDRYGCDVSVIAHSFGTYVVGKYLMEFDMPPVPIDTLILTGGILTRSLDFDSLRGKVFKVINEIAPNDSVIKYAPFASLWRDPLIGRCGDKGFLSASERLQQNTCEIFNHNNVIKRDVITKRWMPWLEVNVGRGREEAIQAIVERP